MNKYFKDVILSKTGASSISKETLIQNLWSDYGEILRLDLTGSVFNSVVVKHVRLPESSNHPRGWNSNISHNRKIKSYRVETQWYKNWSKKCDMSCRVPKCIHLDRLDDEVLIVLEDLNNAGYSLRKTSVNIHEIKLCISWLANFHGTFIECSPINLWEKGTYWHLDTRPEELKALKDKELKESAWLIDDKLENTKYKTILHGDAKLANFCFSKENIDVACVDFQYTGGGVGVKDLAYFIGSCLYEEECESLETELLDHYFSVLKKRVCNLGHDIDLDYLEKSWRELYPVAWTDFHRFLKGWSPGHWKINGYSERVTKRVLENL